MIWKFKKSRNSSSILSNDTKIKEFLISTSSYPIEKKRVGKHKKHRVDTETKNETTRVKIKRGLIFSNGKVKLLKANSNLYLKLLSLFNILIGLICVYELTSADTPSSPYAMGYSGIFKKLAGSMYLSVGYASFSLLLGIIIMNILFIAGKLKSVKYIFSLIFATFFFAGICSLINTEFGGIVGGKIREILIKLGVPENISIALLSSILFTVTFATLYRLIPSIRIMNVKRKKELQNSELRQGEIQGEREGILEKTKDTDYEKSPEKILDVGRNPIYFNEDDLEKTEVGGIQGKTYGITEIKLDETTETSKYGFISLDKGEVSYKKQDYKDLKSPQYHVEEAEGDYEIEDEEEEVVDDSFDETEGGEEEKGGFSGERVKEKRNREKREFVLPSVELLDEPEEVEYDPPEILHKVGRDLLEVLNSFGIRGKIISMRSGPVVNFFEFIPETGIRATRILQLSDDIAIAMRMEGIRVIAPVPGSGALGFEVPRKKRSIVRLKEIIKAPEAEKMKIPLTIGKDIYGNPFVIDLQKLPHLLVAGTTGSGKSVLLNAIIISLLMRFRPNELKFILVDPKMLEFSLYSGIPNLVTDVITNPRGAIDVLRWAVDEMLRRYQIMKKSKTKNIDDYIAKTGEEMPKIIVVIDEFADLMISSARKVEEYVMRLSQMARAAGIHLILTTQRPSADVVTGIIKSNLPARIALRVSDKINSRVIIDTNGAETLLGQGDFLFSMPGIQPKRGHAAFVSDTEISRVVEYLKKQDKPEYIEIVTEENEEDIFSMEIFEGKDPMYKEAVKIAQTEGKISISSLQRKLSIGFNRAGRIIDQMVEDRIIKKDEKMNRFIFVGIPTSGSKNMKKSDAENRQDDFTD